MITLIQKLLFLWEKKMHKTRVICEREYLVEKFNHILSKDDQALRERMSELKLKENPSTEVKKEIMDIEKQINEISMYRQMVEKGTQTVGELTEIIASVKQDLWK